MLRNLDNCFYCQNLGEISPKIGRCAFCGVVNPLYLVNYQGQKKYFCCGCAWWQFPHSEEEKEAENKWYQKRKALVVLEKMRLLDQKLGIELHPARYEYKSKQILQRIEANDEELINRLAEPDFLKKIYGSELLKLKERKLTKTENNKH